MRLENAVIKSVDEAFIVHSEEGRIDRTVDRKYYALSLCLSGQITYTQNGKEYVSTPATAVILPQGQSYSIRRDREGMFPLINFTCEGFLCNTVTVIPVRNVEPLMRDFELLRRLVPLGVGRARIMSVFYNMIHSLCAPDGGGELAPAMRLIESDFHRADLSNDELAAACGISEVYFRRLFSARLGVSPKQYILDIRLQKAKQLLAEGGLKISAVAEMCGFSGSYHFCRLFRRRLGVTPSDYRSQNQITGL